MKLNKVIAIPALALTAGLSLAACGSVKAPVGAVTHAVTAPAAPVATKAAAPVATTPAPTTPAAPTPAPQPAKTVYVPVQQPAQPASDFTNSSAVVAQFYQDITDQNYSAAWALGGDNIGGSDYAGWVTGYSTTASVSLGTFSGFGSDQVQTSLSALQTDGSVNTYEGTYTVSGGVIVAANIVQTS